MLGQVSKICTYQVFEEHLDENAFDMVDANGDGFLQGCEVAVALEDFFA